MSDSMTKILILTANPRGTSELRLGKEFQCIQDGLRQCQYRDRFTIDSEWAVQPRKIRQAILYHQPQIVHFSGHGSADGGLAFENETGQVQFVQPEALAGLFRLFSSHVQCVLLNACYSEIQANAIVENIDFVIGMDSPIGDRAAIEFSTGFYDALGAGKSVETAYRFGCNSIQMAGIPESLTPQLKRKNNISQENDINPYCSKNLIVETETRSSSSQTPIRTTYEFVVSGSIDETERSKLEAMVAHLRHLTGDTSLTLLRVESGSIKLVLEGSEEGFQLLESLVASGELTQVFGVSIQGVNRQTSESSSFPFEEPFSQAEHVILQAEHIYYVLRSQMRELDVRDISDSEERSSTTATMPYVKAGNKANILPNGNYPNIDLRGCNLQGQNLQGCDFSGADLSGANLCGADLRQVNFNGAKLIGANLRMANLIDASFVGANLRRINLKESQLCNVNLSMADLSGSDLMSANMSNANLHKADLQRANLERAHLNHAYLVEANLLRAQLRRAKLNNAQLTRARLDGASLRGTDLSHADLQEVSLSRANLTFATLHNANLRGAWLAGAYMRGANLSSAQLTDADLSGAFLVAANLRDANLQNAKLFRANLSDAILENSNLDDAKLSRAYLSSANLKNATLNRAEMTEVILLRACLQGAVLCHALLNRAYLNEADLSEANLNDANLSSANLARVNLQGAQVIATQFEGSLGIDERLKDDLRQRGAIVMLIPRYPADPPVLGQTDLETLCQISEAKDNIVRRFDDLTEALQDFQKIIGFVKTAVQDHPGIALSDLSRFDQECEGFRESVNVARENIFTHLETVHNGELQQWLIDQYTQELDTIHHNVQRLSRLTYVFHEIWISLIDRIDDEGFDPELPED
jgi:uncharacterized protein YjbI with pentapeptide repeats